MFYKLLGLVVMKGIIMATLIIGIAESSLINGIIVAIISAAVNGFVLFMITRYGTQHVSHKIEEVKEEVKKENNHG